MAIKPRVSNSGRILMVDPNPEGNGTVNLEDLSIIVELDTESKGRSVVNIDSNTVSNTSTKSEKTPVKFINGPVVGDNKNLTTNYTEVNTTFNKKGNDLESLGITDIDIAFNSSYAPMIKINFVDVRGNSVFERGNESDYRVFFDLPYPIFKLTVKGYYGKAVTYCLHLTKWNSLFNSDTGNYEITCEFVGYTYAILTDMLIGYLKGIGETTRGRTRLGKYKLPDKQGVSDGDGNIRIPTILELIQIIEKVNNEVKKLKKSNADVKRLKLADDVAKEIEKLRDILDTFATSINPNGVGQVILDDNKRGIVVLPITDNTILNNQIKTYKENISKSIKVINENPNLGYRLKEKDFTDIPFYTPVKKTNLKFYPNIDDQDVVSRIANKDGRLLNLLTSKIVGKFSNDTPLNVVDLRKSYKSIENINNDLQNSITKQKEVVANIIKEEIPKIIGFKPTIANMLAIFTAHAEVFLDTIKDVAEETTKDTQRTNKLTSFETSDISQQVTNETTGNPSGDIRGEIFPFPEFTTKNGTEVWVGDDVTIPETEFIEDLLRGMLDYSKSEEKILNLLSQESQSWFPVNPLDTEIGGSVENPYTSVSNSSDVNEVLSLVGQRASLFLGYTASDYTNAEIKLMATYEANNLYSILENDIIKDNFKNSFSKPSDILNRLNNLNVSEPLNKNVGNTKGSMFTPSTNSGYLSYNYIHKTEKIGSLRNPKNRPKSYISINKPFNGENFLNTSNTVYKERELKKNNDGVYVSNYANDTTSSNINNVDDGATYVKLIEIDSFNNNTNAVPSILYPDGLEEDSTFKAYYEGLKPITEDFLEEEDLAKIENRGDRYFNYNQFGGTWYTQEFTTIKDIGETDGDDSMLLFYDKTFLNGLGNARTTKIPYLLPNNDTETFKNVGTEVRYKDSGGKRSTYAEYSAYIKEEFTNDTTALALSLGGPSIPAPGAGFSNWARRIGENRSLINTIISTDNNTTIGMPFIDYAYDTTNTAYDGTTSLFGSNFYFEQDSDKARAFLFLHTLPFNIEEGLLGDIVIQNLFKRRAAFIKAPKAWVTFIGGLLWRMDEATDPIKFIYDNDSLAIDDEALIADKKKDDTFPTQTQYLKNDEDNYTMNFEDDDFIEIEGVIKNLPKQVKGLFKGEFIRWSEDDNGWLKIKSDLELFNFDAFTNKASARIVWRGLYNDFLNPTSPLTNKGALKNYPSTSSIKAIKNVDNFLVINKFTEQPRKGVSDDELIKYNFLLEHKFGTPSMIAVVDFITEPIVILNSTWRIWDNNNSDSDEGNQIFKDGGTNIEINEVDLNLYLQFFQNEFNRLNKSDLKDRKSQLDNIKSDLFNSIDNDKIKLNLYRNVKAIYDKWVAGTSDVLAHCGGGNISEKENSEIKNTGGKLINSFHFLSKSFIDIGDTFFINPLGVIDNISGNFNQSLYDLISRTLSDNNFNFNPLPSFINFKEIKEMEEMFTPFPYSKAISATTVGPSFVCTYIGDRSKHLDLGDDASYTNDGFDFKIDGGGVTTTAKAYNEGDNTEMSIPVFAVNYGDQNQSVFKNIKLNQQEYSETDEGLQIMDDISKGGSPNSKTYMGQNMFNVYSTRSYSAEIEMLGNATVQPMMYFQLNSIPMFHGAFLITSVRHKIKPNHMTTTVTGVRVREQDVPLIDEKTVYMNFIDIIDGVKSDGVSLSPTVNIPEWNYNGNITNIIKT